MSLNEIIEPLIGCLGIEMRARIMLLEFGEHHKQYYETIQKEPYLIIPDSNGDFTIKSYIRLTSTGLLEYDTRKFEVKRGVG